MYCNCAADSEFGDTSFFGWSIGGPGGGEGEGGERFLFVDFIFTIDSVAFVFVILFSKMFC